MSKYLRILLLNRSCLPPKLKLPDLTDIETSATAGLAGGATAECGWTR